VGENAAATLGVVRAGRAEDGPKATTLCGLSQRLFIGQHTERIVAMALSPDGRLLATAQVVCRRCCWRKRVCYFCHALTVFLVPHSPFPSQAGKTPLVVLWCLPAGKHVAVLGTASHGQASGLGSGSLAFSLDGSLLALAGRDDKGRSLITVLDVRAPQAAALSLAVAVANAEAIADGRLPRTGTPLPTPTSADAVAPLIARQVSDFHVFRLRFSPYEVDRLVSVGRENVRLWRIRKGHMPGVSVTLGEYARNVVFTDVAFESPAAAAPQVRSSESEAGINEVMGGGGLGASADAAAAEEAAAQPGCLLVASSAGTMLRVRYATRALQGIHRLHEAAIVSIAINDGFCVTAGLDGFLRVWPLDFSDFYLEAGHEGAATSGAISPNGLMVAVGTAALHASCDFAVADEVPCGALADRRKRGGGASDPLVSGTNNAHARAAPAGSRPLARPAARNAGAGGALPMATVGLVDVVTQKYRAVQRGHAETITAIAFRPAPPLLRAPESMVLAAQGGAFSGAAAAARSLLAFNSASRALWDDLLPLLPREVCTAAADGTISVWVFQTVAQQQYTQQAKRSPFGSPAHGSPRKVAAPPLSGSGSPARSPRRGGTFVTAGSAVQRQGLWEQQFEFSAAGDKCTCLAYQPVFDSASTSTLLQAMGAFESSGITNIEGDQSVADSFASPRDSLASPRFVAATAARRQQLQALIDSSHVLACGFTSGAIRVFNVPTSTLLHELRK
jgi:WD40 repeat protein